jgi:hypothetical protein
MVVHPLVQMVVTERSDRLRVVAPLAVAGRWASPGVACGRWAPLAVALVEPVEPGVGCGRRASLGIAGRRLVEPIEPGD